MMDLLKEVPLRASAVQIDCSMSLLFAAFLRRALFWVSSRKWQSKTRCFRTANQFMLMTENSQFIAAEVR
jgi:hypothetical protein